MDKCIQLLAVSEIARSLYRTKKLLFVSPCTKVRIAPALEFLSLRQLK